MPAWLVRNRCSRPWLCDDAYIGLNQFIPIQPRLRTGIPPPPRFSSSLPHHLFLLRGSGLRALRRGCVTSLLEKLFEGKPGAHHALPWVRLHHGDKSGEYGLDDIGLVDWMYGLRDVAATGAYRASLGEAHTVGEKGAIYRRGEPIYSIVLCDTTVCVCILLA